LTPKILAPLSGSLSILSAPFAGLVFGFACTTDRCQPTSQVYPTTFADVGETSPTSKWFRAFAKTHILDMLSSRPWRSCWLQVSSATPTISAFAVFAAARPSPQSIVRRQSLALRPLAPVVRSERSQTDELLRFTFATTCRFAKHSTRTCRMLFRSAYGRSHNLPLIQATNSNWTILLSGLSPD